MTNQPDQPTTPATPATPATDAEKALADVLADAPTAPPADASSNATDGAANASADQQQAVSGSDAPTSADAAPTGADGEAPAAAAVDASPSPTTDEVAATGAPTATVSIVASTNATQPEGIVNNQGTIDGLPTDLDRDEAEDLRTQQEMARLSRLIRTHLTYNLPEWNNLTLGELQALLDAVRAASLDYEPLPEWHTVRDPNREPSDETKAAAQAEYEAEAAQGEA